MGHRAKWVPNTNIRMMVLYLFAQSQIEMEKKKITDEVEGRSDIL